jgi:hypothetical protein
VNGIAARAAAGPRLAAALVAERQARDPQGGPHRLHPGEEHPVITDQALPGYSLRLLQVAGDAQLDRELRRVCGEQ